MPQAVSYTCVGHGKIWISYNIGPGRKAPERSMCPFCLRTMLRTYRRGANGLSVSVRGEVFDRLKAESYRRGVPMRQLIEEYTRDIK